MTPEAVVFDIGNVLIEWQPERFFDVEVGRERRIAMFDAVDLHSINDRSDMGEDIAVVIAEAADRYPEFRDEILLWNERWIDIASPAIDHSVRLMSALQSKGIPVYSLTNFGMQTYDIAARKYPFLRQFDRDFISGHMKVIKPDPAIYRMLEKGSGLSGGALLFADDRSDNIEAAAARGWQTHLFETPQGWADRLVSAGLLRADEAA
ncbi:HAD family phosphatase [Sulfitobacter sp. S190]|uniref:HAD family hydrolase n=1 Tax=Sulfitobacter sp. S190 TaxID=2867022 RepID=UPI0021A77DA1|nr:HAD family phosphatase [Sulfitobacter sp. S190]UWR24261.1 HAD family phosphatase [Sulfitobacter sp. S190]